MQRLVSVPVKDFIDAKQRLVPVLAPAQRRALAAAMLEDVLTALAGARVDAVWVVTRDAAVTALAHRFHVTIVSEVENRGHTAAVAAAQARAQAEGVAVFATIPGDVPCVTSRDIDVLLDAASASPCVVLAASRSGLGTNGAALAPPDAMPLRFGEPSFEQHVAAAKARGLSPRLLDLPGLALDVDGPEDLRALRIEGGATVSGRLLMTWDALTPRAHSRAHAS